jgi:hypothetical protein
MATEPWIPGIAIVALFDILFLAVGVYALSDVVRTFIRSLVSGAAYVRFDRFPFFLGETFDVHVGCSRPLDRFQKLTVTLRFIQVEVTKGQSQNLSTGYQKWAKRLEVDPRALDEAGEHPLSIRLPTGDYGTWIADTPPRYWEIEIEAEGDTPWLRINAQFPVPVYSR